MTVVILNAAMRNTIAKRASEDLVANKLYECILFEHILADDIVGFEKASFVEEVGKDGYDLVDKLLPIRGYIYVTSSDVGVKKLKLSREQPVPGDFLDYENPPHIPLYDARIRELVKKQTDVDALQKAVYNRIKHEIVDQCSTVGSLVGKWPFCVKYLDPEWVTFEGNNLIETLKEQIANSEIVVSD